MFSITLNEWFFSEEVIQNYSNFIPSPATPCLNRNGFDKYSESELRLTKTNWSEKSPKEIAIDLEVTVVFNLITP